MVLAAAREYGVTHRRTTALRLSLHPDAPSDDDWTTWVRDSAKPLAVDLFCGAGGLSYGLEAAGYRVALAADTDEWALESHRHNIPGRALRLDLAEPRVREEIAALLDGVDVGLVAGGPPCQPFSRAGLSKIRSLVDQGLRCDDDVRKHMWRAFLELVEAIRPQAVLMENVPDMALGDNFTVIRTMIECLGEIGYDADARIVDAWRHGVPQHRQRLILVALKDATAFDWPRESGSVTVRQALHDLPRLSVSPDTVLGAPTMGYLTATTYGESASECAAGTPEQANAPGWADNHSEQLSDFAARARDGCTGDGARVVHDHVTRPVRADDFEAFKLMNGRTLYSDLPADLRRYRSDIFDDKYNRLSWDKPSRTITAHLAKDGYWYIHPEQHRSITVREAARLQTFPDTFRFAGCRSHQFQQIGNAVPPVLAQQIGSAILASVRADRSQSRTPSGRLLMWRSRLRQAMLCWLDTDSRARRTVEALGQGGGRNQRWADLLTDNGSGIVDSAPALRVATRVSGSQNGQRPQRSVARMELAKLIGLGSRATDLNIAAHVLGTTICRPQDPLCHGCPVSAICTSRTRFDSAVPATTAG